MSRKMAARAKSRNRRFPFNPYEDPYEGISSRAGKVVFLRTENYMQNAETRQEMEFFSHDGQAIRVIHAFPVRVDAVLSFVRKQCSLKLHRVEPLPGWKVYSLDWDTVQEFVAWGSRGSLMDFSARTTDTPPQVLRFRSSHATRLQWDWVSCWCGCGRGSWDIEPKIRYQVIFAERPVAYVRGRKLGESSE